MRKSIYKSYDDLPMFLNAEHLRDLFGIAKSTAYELMRKDGFPSIRIGYRVVVSKQKLEEWVQERLNTGLDYED